MPDTHQASNTCCPMRIPHHDPHSNQIEIETLWSLFATRPISSQLKWDGGRCRECHIPRNSSSFSLSKFSNYLVYPWPCGNNPMIQCNHLLHEHSQLGMDGECVTNYWCHYFNSDLFNGDVTYLMKHISTRRYEKGTRRYENFRRDTRTRFDDSINQSINPNQSAGAGRRCSHNPPICNWFSRFDFSDKGQCWR